MNTRRGAPADGATETEKINDAEIVRLLSQRFGDGLIYLADETDREILCRAIKTGLVSPDGHLTTDGYRALKRGVRD